MAPKAILWPLILVAAAFLLAAILLVFLGHPGAEKSPTGNTPSTAADGPVKESQDPNRKLRETGGGFADGFVEPSDAITAVWPSGPTPIAETPEEPMQPWEISISKLLDSDDENDKVAADLAALIPTMPLEGQTEAVQHMVNLLEDDKYVLASNMLLNPSLHPDLRAVILADVLDRPNSVKLPVLLAVMAVPGHPSRTEAQRSLAEALGSDFGSDPALWSAPVQSLLAREAEEEAKAEAEAESEDQKTN